MKRVALGRAVLFCIVLFGMGFSPLQAQDTVLDLRFLELNDHGERTYHNFILSHAFGERLSFEAFYLLLPQLDDYDELAAGLGYRMGKIGEVGISFIGYFSSAPDDEYFEPTLFLLDVDGKLTGSLFLLHYFPLSGDGIHQWLVDPVEVQYNVFGSVSIGASGYFYRPQGGSWLTKIGPKISLADRLGASELAVRWVNGGGGVEFQLRRIFTFGH